jgi:hypothetical protein
MALIDQSDEERMMKFAAVAGLSFVSLALTGCLTDKMVLTNDHGQTQTCEFTGHVGLISPIVLHERYKNCVDKAKANGFKEPSAAQPEA